MMKNPKSLIFFGSGPVSLKSLELLQQTFKVDTVVTKTTTRDAMKVVANNSKLFTVSNKSELDELFTSNNLKADVGILIDFGIMLSKKVISSFEQGVLNSHFSLLPELRGADPITFAILKGKKKTGVSLMLLVEAMDEGPVLMSKTVEISKNDTSQTLTTKLVHTSNDLIKHHLVKYTNGILKAKSQKVIQQNTGRLPSYTRKLTKQDGIIDWNKTALQIEREIRAFIDWPKSHTKLGKINVIIKASEVINDIDHILDPGQLVISKDSVLVKCSDNFLSILELQPANKKNMSIQSFLAGYKAKIQS